jgi:hypothetical protein
MGRQEERVCTAQYCGKREWGRYVYKVLHPTRISVNLSTTIPFIKKVACPSSLELPKREMTDVSASCACRTALQLRTSRYRAVIQTL